VTLTSRQYVAGSGHLCPVCRSLDIGGGPAVTQSAIVFHRSMHCNCCGSTWLDIHQRVYRLVGYEQLKIRREHYANDRQG